MILRYFDSPIIFSLNGKTLTTTENICVAYSYKDYKSNTDRYSIEVIKDKESCNKLKGKGEGGLGDVYFLKKGESVEVIKTTESNYFFGTTFYIHIKTPIGIALNRECNFQVDRDCRSPFSYNGESIDNISFVNPLILFLGLLRFFLFAFIAPILYLALRSAGKYKHK